MKAKNFLWPFSALTFLFLAMSCETPKKEVNQIVVPEWTKHVVWYQIFPERFRNGDSSNDPRPKDMYAASNFFITPDDWEVTPWTQDWYKQDKWAEKLSDDFYSNLQLRRYGGDLQGVLDKVDYLKELGITAVYFNPLNDAPSLHKYDARNYHHIDVNFGPDPEGDLAIMATENPNDPSTWQWTSADLLFLELVEALHKNGIRVILDYSWNHTGVEFWAWKDVVKNQANSAYKDWYAVEKFDDPSTDGNEFDYKGWLNIKSLPEWKKINTDRPHRNGFPFEGNLVEGVKKHVFAVTQRWLKPDGDLSKGLDGFRLDVADHIPMGFWREYRTFVKNINPDAYLVGEIWWQDWPDKLMNPTPYLKGDVFDGIMFYQLYKPARYFFAKTDYDIHAKQLKDSLMYQWRRLDPKVTQAMMNTSSTHDAPRLLTSFANKGKYKFKAKPNDDPAYITGKPDAETYQRVKLYLIHQFTIPGAPHIWNGEEMGMWGGDDPDTRKPLWWPDYQFESENRNNIQKVEPQYDAVGFNQEVFDFYKKLIQIRNDQELLQTAPINFVVADGKLLSYKRVEEDKEILVCFNAGETPATFKLDRGKTYDNLLDDDSITYNEKIDLPPLTAVILLRK